MISQLDRTIFYLINRDCRNHLFDIAMPIITRLGSGEFLGIAALLIIIFAKKRHKIYGIFLMAGLTLIYYPVSILKNWIARPRPFTVLPDVHFIGFEKGFSFPSYHATAAFMAAIICAYFFRKCSSVFFVCALFIGFSRIYMGFHYPADVIAGALIGSTAGLVLVYAARSISDDDKL